MKMTLREKYHDLFSNLEKLSTTSSVIDETNVYQVENPVTRKIMDRVVAENTTPDSHLNGIENFEDFYNRIGVKFDKYYPATCLNTQAPKSLRNFQKK